MGNTLWEQVKGLQETNKELREEIKKIRTEKIKIVTKWSRPKICGRGMTDSDNKTFVWTSGGDKCYVCGKHFDINKDGSELYLLDAWSKVAKICSIKCDRRFRLKNTQQIGAQMFSDYGFENVLHVLDIELIRPLVDFQKHKKEVLDKPWNNPEEAEKRMREKVKERKGEIFNE